MIGLYEGTSVLSRAIRFRSWSKYSHASWICPDHSEFEAWAIGGVCKRAQYGQAHTKATVIRLLALDLTPGEEQGLVEFFEKQLGKKYDWGGVFGFLSRRDASHDPEEWFCSELVFAGFQAIRKPLLARIPAHRVDPGMLLYSPLLRDAGYTLAGYQGDLEADGKGS